MKISKKIPLILASSLACILSFGCNGDDTPPVNNDEFDDIELNVTCDSNGVCVANDLINKVKATIDGGTAYPYYIKVGQTLPVSAAPEGVTNLSDEDKKFEWRNDATEFIKFTQDSSKSYVGTVEAIKATSRYTDKCHLKATSVTTPSVYGNFNFHVIDFDSSSMYLWQSLKAKGDEKAPSALFRMDEANYDSDLKKYTNNISLGGLTWTLIRDELNSVNSESGGVALGKNDAPENVMLINENTRAINKIIIETASKRKQASFKCKVGDKYVDSRRLDDISYGEYPVYSISCSGKTGDIQFEWSTPKLDISRIDDESYVNPGATYIKSIWIQYAN